MKSSEGRRFASSRACSSATSYWAERSAAIALARASASRRAVTSSTISSACGCAPPTTSGEAEARTKRGLPSACMHPGLDRPGAALEQGRQLPVLAELQEPVERQPGERGRGLAAEPCQRAVDGAEPPAAVDDPDPERGVLEGRPEALLALAQRRVLLVQVDEDRHLRAQHRGIERLRQVVDGARRVAPEDVLGVGAERRQEDDRDVLVRSSRLM